MTFVCPRCLIFNLFKFTGTFRDTKGIKFGSEEKWHFMVMLCRGCSVMPGASNIHSVEDLRLLITRNPIFEHISRTVTEFTSVQQSEQAFIPDDPRPIFEAVKPHCVLCHLIKPTGIVEISIVGAFL